MKRNLVNMNRIKMIKSNKKLLIKLYKKKQLIILKQKTVKPLPRHNKSYKKK